MPSKRNARDITSSSLLYRVKQHDQQAWERLVKIYSPLVFYWCRRESGLSSDDAADVIQEVFRSVSASIGTFQKQETGTYRGWLRTITANKIRDMIRKRRGQVDAVGGTDWMARLQELPDSTTKEMDAAEDGMVMWKAVEFLTETCKEQSRQAFRLMVIDGRTAAEVADMLDMTERAVWAAAFRIRRRLREELAGLLD